MRQKITQYITLVALLAIAIYVGSNESNILSVAVFFSMLATYIGLEVSYFRGGSLKRLINSSDIPMYFFDKDYKITFANAEFAKLLF